MDAFNAFVPSTHSILSSSVPNYNGLGFNGGAGGATRAPEGFTTSTGGDGSPGAVFGTGTTHLRTTIEADQLEETVLKRISQTLDVLQDISAGRHVVDWMSLVDCENPTVSVQKINAALGSLPTFSAGEAYRAIAACITSPRHLAIATNLQEKYKLGVRDAVLKDLLDQLTVVGDQPMPVCAEMLVEMLNLNLVRLSGVAVMIEQFLSEPDKCRAAIAVLGRVAEQKPGDDAVRRAIRDAKGIEIKLRELYTHPEYEHDVVTITRLLEGADAVKAVSLRAVCTLKQSAPVTCMHYVRLRDELLSSQADGTTTLWGAPNAADVVQPKTVLDPHSKCVPLAMSGLPRGSYAVVAGMPCRSSSPYATFMENRKRQTGDGWSGADGPQLRVVGLNEDTNTWACTQTIPRGDDAILTAVAALSNSTICSAESVYKGAQLYHSLALLDLDGGQVVRTFEQAHDDLTTVLRRCEDTDHLLFSGSRDTTVKVWDSRSKSTAGQTSPSTPLYKLDAKHNDTVSSIFVYGNFVFTGSLDGSMLIWDTRCLTVSVAGRAFSSPVLDITALEGGRAAVSTARGLYLISLETMGAIDVVPNCAYTQLHSNDAANVVFAAGVDGVKVFALK